MPPDPLGIGVLHTVVGLHVFVHCSTFFSGDNPGAIN